MAGQTESLTVPSEEPATQRGDEGRSEEVVASVETGEPDNNFIITASPETPVEEVAENVESEAVAVIEEGPSEIEDEFDSNENVVEETVEETPMEIEDIPSKDEEIPENAIQEESTTKPNIPEDMNTEDPPKGEVDNKPVSNIPDVISNEETSSVQEEPSKPDDNSSEVFHCEAETAEESPPPPPYSSSILKSVVESTITTEPTITTRTTLGSTTIGDTVVPTLRTTVTTAHPPTSHHLSQIPKPPLTDILLQTAREVLQLPEEPGDVKAFLHMQEPGGLRLSQMAGPVVTETVISSGHQVVSTSTHHQQWHHTDLQGEQGINSIPGQRLSLEEENSQQMEVPDENATYILEPVTNEEYYQDDQNIMWIQETVEVEQQESYDSLPNVVIILNPNGTVNEELMLAHGMNLETIKAVTEQGINLAGLQAAEIGHQTSDPNTSIKSLQHPLPRRDLIDVKPLFANQGLRSIVEGCLPVTTEHSRSVILDAKDNFLVLDDLENGTHDPGRDPMIEPLELSQLDPATHRVININGTNHVITSNHVNGRSVPDLKRAYFPTQQLKDQNGHDMNFQVSNLSNLSLPITPLGTLDLSLPKKPDPGIMEQYVNPAALVSENSVLKALSAQLPGVKDPITGKLLRPPGKIRKPKTRDENGNGTPYIHRKTTSLGALGQALHGTMLGIPRDSRENAVQICPICKFQATTKNPYRHLQDHLARVHFKERIAADLPTKKPYICPMAGCDGKHYPDWQAVMRHYIGKKHGILDKFVKETLAEGLPASML